MKDEPQEFGVDDATINPGPFLTGFNDRIFQTWESRADDPSERLVAVQPDRTDRRRVEVIITAAGRKHLETDRRLRGDRIAAATKSALTAREADLLDRVPALMDKTAQAVGGHHADI